MLFAKVGAFSRASNLLLVVCGCLFAKLFFRLLLFVKWDVFSGAYDLFLCAACFQVLSLVCLFGQLFFVNCFLQVELPICLLCVAALVFCSLFLASGLALTHLVVSRLFFWCG